MNKYQFFYQNDIGDTYPADRKEAEIGEPNDISGPYYLCADVDATIKRLRARISNLEARIAEPVAADEEVRRRFAAAFAEGYKGYWGDQSLRERTEYTLRIALEAINKQDPPKDTRIYPFMACPNADHQMDPLEGCRACGSTGYHNSVPNPEWEKRFDSGQTSAEETQARVDTNKSDEKSDALTELPVTLLKAIEEYRAAKTQLGNCEIWQAVLNAKSNGSRD